MRVWQITIGEPLPSDGPNERLLRTGLLANRLASRGHDVVWWTSTFDHVRKRHRFQADQQITYSDRLKVRLLHANSYPSNVSIRRIMNHRRIAYSFREQSRSEQRPDVILCSWPTVELCVEAVRIGEQWGIPTVLDVRDLWPDAIADLAPRVLQPAARLALRGDFHRAHFAASRATAIVGITDEYVDWGLDHARRTRSDLDCHFPLGYVDQEPSKSQIDVASKFWNEQGITLDGSDFIACWFGTFGRNSEIATVLAAARRLASLGKPVKFVLCGTGPDFERHRRNASDCANVLMPGWINAAQIWTLLRASSLGLAPYVSNHNYVRNIPNKPVEYLSAGLPIISSLQGVLARLLEQHHCGVTYRNGDSIELANAIIALTDNARREQMSENAARLYRSQFVADRVYAAMEDHLIRIVASQNKSILRTA
jgi:glycosyltransferase involved in cell wall biosynthesis